MFFYKQIYSFHNYICLKGFVYKDLCFDTLNLFCEFVFVICSDKFAIESQGFVKIGFVKMIFTFVGKNTHLLFWKTHLLFKKVNLFLRDLFWDLSNSPR